MTGTLRIVMTVILFGVLTAAAAYLFREQLADTPSVVTVMNRLGWSGPSADADEMPEDMSAAMPLTPESTVVGSPRAEVQIDSRRQQLIGVRTELVERQVVTKPIRAVGTVRYDETRLADVNVKVAGWIEELYVDTTGQLIEAGQPLFTIYSPELLTTQQEYLLALESRAQIRESQLLDARVYADRLVDAARQRLVLWDLPPDEIQSLKDRGETQRTMLFRAPVGGFVIDKHLIRGQHVTPGMSLYTVADLSAVWVEADLYEEEIPLVTEGARASVTLDAYPENTSKAA